MWEGLQIGCIKIDAFILSNFLGPFLGPMTFDVKLLYIPLYF